MLFLIAAALTPTAQWISDVFFALDKAILEWYHSLALSAGQVLTPLADLVSWTGWKGLFLIVVTLILLLFRKTRKTGLYCAAAMLIGYVLVNVLIKPAIARPRPYAFDETIRQWWDYVSGLSFSLKESDLSFPSGHMNAACAFAGGVVFSRGKKWLAPMLVYVILMGMSRNYLQVHYPSDILFAFCTGLLAAVAGALLMRTVYRKWGESKLLREG